MTDNENTAEFQHEGQPAFDKDTEKDNSTDSPSDETSTDETQTEDGDKKNKPQDSDKDIPFHDHPRWKEREDEWKQRFNESETRHQDDLKKLREEFGDARKANAEQTEIPSWFGGNQEAWNAYRKDRDAEIAQAEERAFKRISETKGAEDKAVKEATDYMHSELSKIESDKTLNPTGAKIDPNKLLKFVLDNDLVDSQGKWNYRAGFRMMQGAPLPKKDDRKAIAGATTTGEKGETKPAPYKTSADFKKNRPW